MPLSDAPVAVWLRDRSGGITAAGIVLALLYAGRAVLIPLALAIMLSLLLARLVRALRRVGVTRIPSVLLTVVALMVASMAVAVVLGVQILRLAEGVPQYEANVQRKLRTLDELTVGRLDVLTSEASRLIEIHGATSTLPGTAKDLERSAPARLPSVIASEPG